MQTLRSRPARSWRKPELSSRWARPRSPRPLELLCACLSAGQLGRSLDTAFAAKLTDASTDLVALARLAGRHRVTPMLAPAIAAPELQQRLPEDFRLYLQFVHAENDRRNHALRRQLGQTAVALNEVDIEPLLLKGAVRLVDGPYPDLGWRFMRDLDLLIPRDRLGQAVACLESLGYFTPDTADLPTHGRHLPPLTHEGAVAVLELHTDLLDSREILPAEHVLARSRLLDLDGARVRVPDAADQLLHLLGHDRFDGDLRRSGMFLLRSIFETTLLCHNEHSLSQLLDRVASTPLARHARVRLALAVRLFPNYFAPTLHFGLDDRMLARALLGLEQLDENGRLRRLFGYGRLQLGNLLGSPAWRKQFAANIKFAGYRRHCLQRLCRLWSGD